MASNAAQLYVDLDAIAGNYNFLNSLTFPAKCAGVVKADAYGLGAAVVSKRLFAEGCDVFFVALAKEARVIREAVGPKPIIYVLNGFFPEDLSILHLADARPVLNSLYQVSAYNEVARTSGRVLSAGLQIDSGMSRLGLSDVECEDFDASLTKDLNITLFMSHLACADQPDASANALQLESFRRWRGLFPAASAALANSSGIFLGSEYHWDICRPGAGLYGLELGPKAHGILPVVTLKAPIIQFRTVQPGAHIGYGHVFEVESTMRLATVGIGYADGIHRQWGKGGAVYVGDYMLPVVGRISMDSMVVDATCLPEDKCVEGLKVDIMNERQTPDDVGRVVGSIGYEVLTALSPRLERVYLHEKI